MRYYARVAPALLPVIDGRPLVMKRYPNGIAAKPFYQHRAPDDVPDGVQVAAVEGDTDVPASRDRRRSRHADVHDAARRDLPGPVVFARRAPRRPPTSPPSISIPRRASPLRACSRSRDGSTTSSRRSAPCRPPKTSGADGLHIYIPPAAGHAVRGRTAVLPDRRDRRRPPPSERRPRSSARSARAAIASTSTACRTRRARRSRAPTARAPASGPASRRRSPGGKSTKAWRARTSRSGRCPSGSPASAISGSRS